MLSVYVEIRFDNVQHDPELSYYLQTAILVKPGVCQAEIFCFLKVKIKVLFLRTCPYWLRKSTAHTVGVTTNMTGIVDHFFYANAFMI